MAQGQWHPPNLENKSVLLLRVISQCRRGIPFLVPLRERKIWVWQCVGEISGKAKVTHSCSKKDHRSGHKDLTQIWPQDFTQLEQVCLFPQVIKVWGPIQISVVYSLFHLVQALALKWGLQRTLRSCVFEKTPFWFIWGHCMYIFLWVLFHLILLYM